MHPKSARRALRFLESEQLVAREHRKEVKAAGASGGTAAGALSLSPTASAADSAAATATADGAELPRPKTQIHSYACIDWPRLLDVVRWRRHAAAAALAARAAGAAAVLRYDCPACGKAFDTLHAARLIDPADGEFHCDGESCGRAVLVAAGGGARGAEAAEAAAALERANAEFKAIDDALAAVDDALAGGAEAPDFGGLGDWAVAAAVAAAAARGGSRPGAAGEADVAVELGATAGTVAPSGPGAPKELPPWLRAAAADAAAGAAPTPPPHAPPEAQAAYAAAYAAEVERRTAARAAEGGGRDPKRARVDGTEKKEASPAGDAWEEVAPAAKEEPAAGGDDDWENV